MKAKQVVCGQCGAPIASGMQFCERCGAAVPPPKQKAEENTMEWVASLSILQNRVVVRQLGLVFFLPLLFLALLLIVVSGPTDWEGWVLVGKIVLITAAVLLALLLIAVFLFYGGRYEYKVRLDEKGIDVRPYGRTAKKNTIANTLLIFSGRPGAMGAGMLAQSRQDEYVAWKEVDRVIPDERDKTITLQKGRRPLMVFPCNDEEFEAVVRFAQGAAARARERPLKKKKRGN